MYPKAGEADELKMASNYSGHMLMPEAFVLFFLTNCSTQPNNTKSENSLVSLPEYPCEPLLGKRSTTKIQYYTKYYVFPAWKILVTLLNETINAEPDRQEHKVFGGLQGGSQNYGGKCENCLKIVLCWVEILELLLHIWVLEEYLIRIRKNLDFWLCLKCTVLHPLNIFYRGVATGEIQGLIHLKMTVWLWFCNTLFIQSPLCWANKALFYSF